MRTALYWIEGPLPGRLAIMPRPRGGDWLEEEIRSWRREAINMVVSVLTTEETAELDLGREQKLCEEAGIVFIVFPIVDRGVPSSRNATLELIHGLHRGRGDESKIAIHCRQGIDRASLLAACVLAASGVDPASAWERITAARGCAVPDTIGQREWLKQFSRDMLACPAAEERELGLDPESL